MFLLTELELGTLKVGGEAKLNFPYNQDVAMIKKIVSPCTCTGVNNDFKQRAIVGSFTAQPIPIHLSAEGVTTQNKEMVITVDYINTDETTGTQNLIFKATIVE